MGTQEIRYFQVGSYAVGNRLLDPAQRTVQSEPDRANALTCGHRACQGCGEALGARYVVDAALRATGVAAALRANGQDDIRVLAQGGDGGTVDIGFGCLSGMFERDDDVLYVCYDNQGYMNTGVQR